MDLPPVTFLGRPICFPLPGVRLPPQLLLIFDLFMAALLAYNGCELRNHYITDKQDIVKVCGGSWYRCRWRCEIRAGVTWQRGVTARSVTG